MILPRSSYRRKRTGRATLPITMLVALLCRALPCAGDPSEKPERRGPNFLLVEPESGKLIVLCERSSTIVRIDPQTGKIEVEAATGESPFALSAHPDGRRLYVSCRRGQEIIELDAHSLETLRRFPLIGDPTGVAVSADGRTLYAAVHSLDQIAVFDLDAGVEVKRLAAGNGPGVVRLSPREGRVYVTNVLPNIGPPDQPCENEITVIDDRTARVVDRIILVNANVGRHIDFSSDGSLAVVAISRPKNLIPMTQVARGWVVTNGFVVLTPGSDVPPMQLLVDLPNQAYADPYAVAIAPDNTKFYLTSAGLDTVLVVDLQKLGQVVAEAIAGQIPRYSDHLGLSRRYVTARIKVGANPHALAFSNDGRSLYVANRLDDTISVIDTKTDQVVRTLVLVPGFDGMMAKALQENHPFHIQERAFEGQYRCADCHEDVNTHRVLQGERMFHSAARTFQGQFACVSCHPDTGFDGLQYDLEPDGLGRNIVDNRNMRGVGGTGPFKWVGSNPDITDQCGTRTAKWIVRTGWLNSVHVVALAAYIRSIKPVVNPYRLPDGRLTPAQRRGKAIFERETTNDGRLIHEMDRCDVCHAGPPVYFRQEMFDVGSKQPGDYSSPYSAVEMAGPDRAALARKGTTTSYDTAHLIGIFDSAPYLHHGKAATLEEIWTKYDPEGRHGATNDLTKQQLNDLIEYLKTL